MSSHRPLSPPLRVAVIGGGVTGLAAAHRLHRLLPHATLHVFDAGDRLGGPLHTLSSDGLILEQGADSFLTKTLWAVDLCRELGLADQLVPTNEHHRRALVVRDGKLLPIPDGFVLMRPHNLKALWRSPVLSLSGKLRVLAEPLVQTPAAVNRPGYDESVASFARRRLGRQAFERLVQPLIAGIFVADAERLSLAATFPEFLEAERQHGSLLRSVRAARRESQSTESSPTPNDSSPSAARYGAFVTLRGGMGRMIDALAASLPAGSIKMQTAVRDIRQTTSGHWEVKSKEGAAEPYDGVIIASAAPVASTLVADFDSTLAGLLARIQYASSTVVTLVYPRDQVSRALDAFGAVVPAVERRPIIAVSFPGVKFPHASPADHIPLRVFMGGVLHPEMVDRSDLELVAIARQQVEALIGATGTPAEVHVARWRGSMPQYEVGHLDLVAQIDERITAYAGLELAGSAYRGVGIPQCIHSGRSAAERLVKQLSELPLAV